MALRRPALLPTTLRALAAPSPYITPLRCALSAHQQSRSFRNAAVLQAAPAAMRIQAMSQPSMRVQLSKHMQDNIPNDIGLLPHTFVMPAWKNRPSIIKNTKDRLTLTKGFFKSKLGSMLEMAIFKWKSPLPLTLSELRDPPPSLAIDRYTTMYTSLAEGDLEKLKPIVGSGLLDKLMKQVMGRRHVSHQKLVWVCKDLKAKRVGNRAFHFWGQGIEMRQVVFKMESVQQLKRVKLNPRNPVEVIGDAPGKQAPERKVVEYVVFQKKKVGDQPVSSWYLWGTVDETTPEAYRIMEKTQPGHVA